MGQLKYRKLRIAFSVLCCIVALLLCGLWVRSYHDMEEWRGRLPGSYGFLFRSYSGQLTTSGFSIVAGDVDAWPNDWHLITRRRPNRDDQIVRVPPWSKKGVLEPWGFNDTWSSSSWVLMLPYWFLVAASGSLAIIFQTRWPPWRFTLRGLFVVTTFLAVLLGMVVCLDRAWIGR